MDDRGIVHVLVLEGQWRRQQISYWISGSDIGARAPLMALLSMILASGLHLFSRGMAYGVFFSCGFKWARGYYGTWEKDE